MSVLNENQLLGSSGAAVGGGYNLENSLRFRSSASAYLSRTNSSSPTNAKIGSLSMWVKRGSLATGNSQYLMETGTGATNNTYFSLFFSTANVISAGQYSQTPFTNTSVLFRDTAAWYHIFIAYDSTQGTAANRFKLYVNNELLTSSTTISLNNEWAILQASQLINIGRHTSVGRHLDGYITEFNLVDGQALTPSDFGETNEDTGVWQPIEYTGTYGTNGYYLNGSTSASTVLDQSGNSNNWTANNMNLTNSALATYDIMTDVPTLTDEDTANYATMNPLVRTSGTLTFSEGNLKNTFVSAWTIGLGTIALPTSGKFYWESTIVSGGNNLMFGLYNPTQNTEAASAYTHTGGAIFYFGNGNKYINGVASAYGATFTTGNTIGVAVNLDANTITFYKNNVSQGAISFAANMIGIPLSPAFLGISSSAVVNFGQRPFAYTPPTGYLKLNTFNLPDSSIVDGSENFGVGLWTGNGSASGPSVTNLNFKPELLWSKSRSTVANNYLYDIVRSPGDSPNKFLGSNTTDADQTFNAFTLTDTGFNLATTNVYFNQASATYVAWNWKAGGTAVSNTDGTITSSVSANPTAGFSVLTFTGTQTNQTVGHGLGVAPEIIITKPTIVQNWVVGATSIGWTKYLHLNLTNAAGTSASPWNNTAPTSSVYSVGIAPDTNNNGNTMVAYCFASIEGYSKIGTYTGNGSTDGPFVYTGFRPAFVMIKNSSVGSGGYDWVMIDTSRSTYNIQSASLSANLSSAEYTGTLVGIDILSNGFKSRVTNAAINGNGNKMIYMAFAENPFKNSLAR